MEKGKKVLDTARLRSYNWDRFTSSNKVSLSPCFVGTVIVTGDAQGVPVITLYDGESANDPVLFQFNGINGGTKQFHLQPPLKTERGLYLLFGDNATAVLIEYERLQE